MASLVLVLYGANRFLLKPVVGNSLWGYLVKCHVNDYLGGILFLAYTNLLISRFLEPSRRIVRVVPTILVGVVCALCWEGIAPMLLPYSTADILDGIAYILGSLTYWCINRTVKERKKRYG